MYLKRLKYGVALEAAFISQRNKIFCRVQSFACAYRKAYPHHFIILLMRGRYPRTERSSPKKFNGHFFYKGR